MNKFKQDKPEKGRKIKLKLCDKHSTKAIYQGGNELLVWEGAWRELNIVDDFEASELNKMEWSYE